MDYSNTIEFIKNLYANHDIIHLHEPILGELEKEYLCDAIDSTFVSSVGPFVEQFEKDIAQLTGAKHAIAINNGTSALHLSLVALGVEPKDAVITQALSFVATANAISYCHAEPIFIDINEQTLSLCPVALENFLLENCKIKNGYCVLTKSNQKIKACIPMHTFGHPAKIKEILKVCNQWHIKVIEDAAESLGSYVDDQHTGTFGEVGILSFNGNKIITAGGGGCILTNNQPLAKKLKHLSTTAKVPDKNHFIHDDVGYNYRLPNINAALLMAQLKQFDNFLNCKRDIAMQYNHHFKNLSFNFFEEPSGTKSNYWLNTIITNNEDEKQSFLSALHSNNIMARGSWLPLNDLPMYQFALNDGCSVSQDYSKRIINLPSGVPRRA